MHNPLLLRIAGSPWFNIIRSYRELLIMYIYYLKSVRYVSGVRTPTLTLL